MTSTRRSLTVLGVLLAVLAASTGIAQAQTGTPSVPAQPAVATYGYGGIRVTIEAGSNTAPTDQYDIRYEKVESGTDFPGENDVIVPVGVNKVYDLTGLDHGTRYLIAARSKRAGEDNSAWSTSIGLATLTAPALGRVMGVKVTAMDKGAMATWTAIADVTGAPIGRYEWRATTTASGGSNGFVAGTETEAMITGLTNGVEYTVSVRAWGTLNDAVDTNRGAGPWSEGMKVTPMMGAGDGDDDEDEEPMPTPAVPLAGVLALFAGLLAAARARLRRR